MAHCGSVFGFLLDDSPLPPGESSSSALTAMAFHAAGPGGKDSGGDSSSLQEVEKGLLMLIASDTPGLQVRSWQITLLLVQFGMGCWTHNLYILKATVLQQNNLSSSFFLHQLQVFQSLKYQNRRASVCTEFHRGEIDDRAKIHEDRTIFTFSAIHTCMDGYYLVSWHRTCHGDRMSSLFVV